MAIACARVVREAAPVQPPDRSADCHTECMMAMAAIAAANAMLA
jgi:hypothetical protein